MGEEILRGQLVEKGKASKLAVVMTGVTLWVVEIAITLPLYDLGSAKDCFFKIKSNSRTIIRTAHWAALTTTEAEDGA